MYKTVRQGENSLQYTILPQQDEGRNGAGGASVGLSGGGGRRGGPRHSRKKSIAAYIGLFFICTIITFAILIPLMVTSDLMPTPASWFYRNQQKTRDFRTPVSVKLSVDGTTAGRTGPAHQSPLEINNHLLKGTPIRTTPLIATTTTTTSTQKPTTIIAQSSTPQRDVHGNEPLWSDALSVTEFQNLYKSDESMEQVSDGVNGDPLDESLLSHQTTTSALTNNNNNPKTVEQQIEPTAPVKNLLLARSRQQQRPMVNSPTTARPAQPSTLSSPRNYPKHFSLQNKQNEKITPPSETRKPLQLQQDTKPLFGEGQGKDHHPNWLQTHWSYVDPYLQWRNYAPEDDRVVLPIILGIALTMIVVIMLFCYLVKRKRVCRMCKKKPAGNNRSEDVEAQDDEEDQANLLTNDNQSEEE